ncbi:MAG: hypothetical protein IT426_09640 [Pirellulales bacterium]|nr:hypothetical protein [Pirellulales bacterium]
MNILFFIGAICAAFGQPESTAKPLASIRLNNATPCADAGLVEVPIGSLATPGEIDWTRVRLMRDGREIPFAVREGRPRRRR